MYCTKCGQATGTKNNICDECLQNEMHEMAQEMGALYEISGKDEAELPQKKSATKLIILSVVIPIVGVILGIISFSNGERRAGRTYLLTGLASWALNVLIAQFLIR